MPLPNSNSPPRGSSLITPPPKRITTPAGMRLTAIMEDNNAADERTPRKIPFLGFGGKPPLSPTKEYAISSSGGSEGSSRGYSYSIFAEKAEIPPRRLDHVRSCDYIARKGGWKRLLLFTMLFLITMAAIITGIALGVQKHNEAASKVEGSPAAAASDSASSATPGIGGVLAPTGTTGPASATSTAVSKNFPLGTYSFVSFLDTVQTDCVSNPNTWTCFPYTIYNGNQIQAMVTFNWIISQGASQGEYKISSTNNPFAISFQNVDLQIVDKGKDTELYHFQITLDKEVIPTAALTDDNSSSECFFNSTTFTGFLYTKLPKTFPSPAQIAATSNPAYPLWPFEMRAEQTIGGGDNVPACYKTNNGNIGERIPEQGVDPTTLCSCLYKNTVT